MVIIKNEVCRVAFNKDHDNYLEKSICSYSLLITITTLFTLKVMHEKLFVVLRDTKIHTKDPDN